MGVYDAERELAETKRASVGKEYGASGTTNFGGILSDTDYNRSWTSGYGSSKWTIIDRMRKSDGQVQSTLQFCRQPIMAALFDVQPLSDTGQDKEIADFIEWNLLQGLSRGWRYVLYHLLLSLEFGFMVMEKVWAYDKLSGRVYCQKLAPRMPSTISKWNVSKDGNLETVEQMVTTGKTEPMPAEKILHIAQAMEGDNWEGMSILRPAWKHWVLKETFEKVAGMSYERFGMGLPVFTEAENMSQEERDELDAMGENIRAHEKGFIRKPKDVGFEVIFGNGWKSPNAEVRYHNEMISAGILQQFVNLGSTETGSRAVGEVLQDPYYLALEGIASQLCELLNTSLIPELVDYNWSGVKEYPKITVSNIRSKTIDMVAEALSKLAAAGFVMPDMETEKYLRKVMDLPEVNEDERAKAAMPTTEGQPDPGDGDNPPGLSEGVRPFALAEFVARRGPKDFEACVDFAEIHNQQRAEVARASGEFAKVRAGQIKQLSTDLAAMIVSGRIDPNKLKVAQFGKAAAVVKASMARARTFGKDQLSAELKKQNSADVIAARAKGQKTFKDAKKKKPGPIIRESPEFEIVEANRADLVVAASNNQLLQAALNIGPGLAKEVGLDPDKLKQSIEGYLDKLSNKTVESQFSGAFMEAFNEGRAESAAAMAEAYATAYRSGLLDGNICGPCSMADGEEYSVADAVDATLPDPDCDGGDACRCMMIFVSNEEEEAVK